MPRRDHGAIVDGTTTTYHHHHHHHHHTTTHRTGTGTGTHPLLVLFSGFQPHTKIPPTTSFSSLVSFSSSSVDRRSSVGRSGRIGSSTLLPLRCVALRFSRRRSSDRRDRRYSSYYTHIRATTYLLTYHPPPHSDTKRSLFHKQTNIQKYIITSFRNRRRRRRRW